MRYIASIISVFLVLFSITNAQIVITEIMYDVEGSDSGREWIEIINMDSSSVDITEWKFFENGTNHGLTIVNGDANIKSGDSAIIVDNPDKFSVDNPEFSGTVFDSSFSLKNTGELIAIRDTDLNDIDSLIYDPELGAGGDGNSLQLVSLNWIASTPTVGFVGIEDNAKLDENESQQSQISNSNQEVSSGSSFPVDPQIFANAGGDRNVIVGADSLFEGEALGLQKKPLKNVRYIWNFGNGETKEGQNVLHYYQYPGEYVVILNVSSGEYSAMDRILVSAYPAEVVISKVESDFIELHNESNIELNLSWWQIQSSGNRFVIPKNTIILPNKKLIFSKEITGLNTDIKNGVVLLYPNGVEAVAFEQIKIPQKVFVVKTPAPTAQVREPVITKAEPIKETKEENDILVNTAQAASVSNIVSEKKESGMYKWLLAIFGVIGVSAGIMVYASGKRELGDDIEILE